MIKTVGRYAYIVFQYIVGALMVVGGALTIQEPLPHIALNSVQSVLYSHLTIAVFGGIFMIAGAGLIYSNIYKLPRLKGHSLFWLFTSCLFGTLMDIFIFYEPLSVTWQIICFTVIFAVMYIKTKVLDTPSPT